MPDNKLTRFVFSSQQIVNKVIRIISLLTSLLSLGLIIYFYGFPQNNEGEQFFIQVFEAIFALYVLSFGLRFFFNLERLKFIKRNWFEGLLMVLLLIDLVSLYLFGFPIINSIFDSFGFENFTFFYLLFIQIYLLLFVGIDAVKLSSYAARFKIKTTAVFGASFIILIFTGAGLLMLPEMTTIKGSMPFWDALFTSVSASCVTGLIVVDTATYFTLKGQFIILLLFQVGGIGIITFALFFAFFLRSGAGIQSQNTVQEMLNTANLVASRDLLKQVIILTFIIEAISSVLIYASLGSAFEGANRVFHAIFHAISAFCNAGFSLYSNGLFEEVIQTNYLLHWIIAGTIFFGSLGFPAIQDIFSRKKLKERMRFPWKDYSISTKIALYSSIILTIVGAIFVYLLEYNHTLIDQTYFGKVTGAMFQSVTTRTAGFNTVDFSLLTVPTLIVMIFLMFIGASSASTGGGIKTSTFVVIFLSVFATIRNRNKVELGGRTISTELLNRAFSIFIFAATYVFAAVFVMSLTDPNIDIINICFEVVSAFCTVGVSTGITADLSFWGKVVIMLSMYLGRVGILTLVIALSSATSSKSYTYPKAHVMIG